MNIKVVALAAILGLSSPAITDIAVGNQAVASRGFNYPRGEFRDQEWRVNLSYKQESYNYQAKNLNDGTSLFLRGARKSGDDQRQIYTWRNGQYSYQVVWRPNAPNTIRLQVFAPNGRTILNRLLYN
ncbi:MAG: hypothetical protein DSM106950_22280 [Stigonema ocellatum SAG 48.90 = DSM 106950]|nr:hypothetical protein [Stigonema ocellatum SAG 48.90 = DSM 106950]